MHNSILKIFIGANKFFTCTTFLIKKNLLSNGYDLKNLKLSKSGRDQNTLDAILDSPIKTFSENVKKGYPLHNTSNLRGIDLTNYALGLLKEFTKNQKSH